MFSLLPTRFPVTVSSSATRAAVRHFFLAPRSQLTASSLPLARAMATSPYPPSSSEKPTASEPGGNAGAGDEDAKEVVVQYVVLRRDLIDTWPLGSVVSQGCHAAVAAVWAHRHHPNTADYCSDANLDSMHKVTLEVKGEAQMRNLSEKLTAKGIDHKLWIEQPENIPTCIATRPYPKSQVASFFKKLKLCK